MTWFIFFFLASLSLTYVYFRSQWKKQMDGDLEYLFEFSAEEVFTGEFLYLDQVVVNHSDRSIPFLKTETLLPEGLRIVLGEREGTDNGDTVQSVQSVFVLHPHSRVSRRWRIVAETRGTYTAHSVQMHVVSNDAIGMGAYSKRLLPRPSAKDQLLVLPSPAEWLTQMALSPSYTGQRTATKGLIYDPMSVCGVREYQTYDAMNTIDWKQSARLGQMMVRQYEIQQNDSYNIVLNMQSSIIEHGGRISTPRYIEDGISLCASLLDSALRRNIPVRLIANTPPTGPFTGAWLHDGPIGRQIFRSKEMEDKSSIMDAYRILARIPMERSVPVERMMDDMAEHPHLYARGGNIIMVTAFLDQRMVNFHRLMAERGVNVIFYVISTQQNAIEIPSDVEAYFRISGWIGGVGYAS